MLADIPPITRALMVHQVAGLVIESLGYFSRYDLYFNLEKIVSGGEVG